MALEQLTKLSAEDMAKHHLVKVRTVFGPEKLMVYQNENANYLIMQAKGKFVVCMEYGL